MYVTLELLSFRVWEFIGIPKGDGIEIKSFKTIANPPTLLKDYFDTNQKHKNKFGVFKKDKGIKMKIRTVFFWWLGVD